MCPSNRAQPGATGMAGAGRRVTVDCSVEEGLPARWDDVPVHALVMSIVEREMPPGAYRLGLHLVGEETIRALNREHRGKDVPTDVLSFPLWSGADDGFVVPDDEPIHLGDVVISAPRAVAQAEEYGHSLERELAYLTAHGVLHLLGHDHEQEEERRQMRVREEEALRVLGLAR